MITNRLIFLGVVVTVLFLNSIFLAQINNSISSFIVYKSSSVNIHENITKNFDNANIKSFKKNHSIETTKKETQL